MQNKKKDFHVFYREFFVLVSRGEEGVSWGRRQAVGQHDEASPLTAPPAAAATPASPPPVSHARDVIVCPARRRSLAAEARDAFLDDALHVQFFKTPP